MGWVILLGIITRIALDSYIFFHKLFNPNYPQCHFLLVYTGWVMVLVLLYIQHFQSSLLATLFYHSMVIQHGAWFCGVSTWLLYLGNYVYRGYYGNLLLAILSQYGQRTQGLVLWGKFRKCSICPATFLIIRKVVQSLHPVKVDTIVLIR